MRKVLIPKKDYVKELIKIIRVTKDEQKLRNLLSDYHEKDIAEAITFLTETERKAGGEHQQAVFHARYGHECLRR